MGTRWKVDPQLSPEKAVAISQKREKGKIPRSQKKAQWPRVEARVWSPAGSLAEGSVRKEARECKREVQPDEGTVGKSPGFKVLDLGPESLAVIADSLRD